MQTLSEFDQQFGTDEACKQFLVEMRWPNGVHCPRCDNPRVYKLNFKPWHWVCKVCGGKNGYRFSILTGTIFQDTKVSLSIWFKIGYLMLTAKKGISALQIHRVIFGEDSTHDYHTSWYICQRWRAAMRGEMYKMDGVVEVDETYIGGKDRNRHKGKKSADKRKAGLASGYAKVGVIGAIARKGNVVARVIGGMDAPALSSFVDKVTASNVRLVATDQNEAYNYVRRDLPHESVNHSKDEWVRGEVHTNSIESFWSLAKRGIIGAYHNVSKAYLPLYLNEFSFRFNNRKNPDMFAAMVTTCGRPR